MLLDQVDYHNRRVRYRHEQAQNAQAKWRTLTSQEQDAIRLVVTNAVHAGVTPTPRSISAFLLERLGVWVSEDEVQAALAVKNGQSHRHCLQPTY